MARIKRGFTTHRRHKKVLNQASGFRGTRNRLFKRANEAVMRSLAYQYRDRRTRKRMFRRLWIVRINAAARTLGHSYSKLLGSLGKAGIALNRKMLAEIAISDPGTFAAIAAAAK